MMKLKESPALQEQPGNFGVAVDPVAKELLLPKNVMAIAERHNLKTAQDLVTFAAAFPVAISVHLRWKPMEAVHAAQELEVALIRAGVIFQLPPNARKMYGRGPFGYRL